MNKDDLVAEMLNTKAEKNNIIDLNAYGSGLIDMYNRLVNSTTNGSLSNNMTIESALPEIPVVMKDYLDSNTRICLKWCFLAFNTVFVLQRRKWYGWKTVSWIYPSFMKNENYQYIKKYLKWEEDNNKSEKNIGKQLMTM